jgi:hypothetical protein
MHDIGSMHQHENGIQEFLPNRLDNQLHDEILISSRRVAASGVTPLKITLLRKFQTFHVVAGHTKNRILPSSFKWNKSSNNIKWSQGSKHVGIAFPIHWEISCHTLWPKEQEKKVLLTSAPLIKKLLKKNNFVLKSTIF